MKHEDWKARKIVVVGAGAVGSTFCYALAQSGLADEIAVIDQNRELVQGQMLDLAHGEPFFPTVKISEGQISDYADAQVIVITAGAKQVPGESRLNLLRRNANIIESIVHDIVSQDSRGVMLVVSNPVDVLTYVALKESGWTRGRVLGSGTVLDSARLRHLLSHYFNIDVHNVHAYVLGEHGDSEFAAWSLTNVAGTPIDEYCAISKPDSDWRKDRSHIEQEVRDSAYHIIDYKGATHFAVGLALVRIVSSILRGQRSVLTVSALLDGEYGLNDVCLSVPSIVSEKGVESVIENRLSEKEQESLCFSASVLKKAMAELHMSE